MKPPISSGPSKEAGVNLMWNRVADGLPTEYGDYLVVREHAELHSVTLAVTNFHPKATVNPWYDKGFIYLYWIGPVEIPKELEPELIGRYRKSAFAPMVQS